MLIPVLVALLACSLKVTSNPVPATRDTTDETIQTVPARAPVLVPPPPKCKAGTTLQDIDTCDAGNGILVVDNPPKILPPPAHLPGDASKFVSFQALVNQGDQLTSSLPPCHPSQVIQNANGCRQQYPAMWGFSVTVPDPSGASAEGLTTTWNFDAANACPYAKVQNYRFMNGTVANATTIEMWDDIGSVDDQTYEENTNAELFDILQRNRDQFQRVFEGDLYDYMGLKGTFMDPNIMKLNKRTTPLAANNPLAPTSNAVVAMHRRGDFRVWLFGICPTYGIAVAWAYWTTREPVTGLKAAQSQGPLLIAMTGGMIAFNVRDRWRRPLEKWTRPERFVRSAWIRSIAFILSCSTPAMNWFKKKYPELTKGLPSLAHRDAALEGLPRMSANSFSITDVDTGSTTNVQLVPELALQTGRDGPMTMLELEQYKSALDRYGADFKAQCEWAYATMAGGRPGRLPLGDDIVKI